jgi:hypothetical protein
MPDQPTEVTQKVEYESKLYGDRTGAEEALERLQAIGYGRDHVSLIIDERDLPVDQGFESDTSPLAERGGMGETGEMAGAIGGGLIGAVVAAAVGTSLALTTGVGVVVGPLVLVLMGLSGGAAWGTIIGGLLELGIEAEDWRVGLQRGGIVVIVALKSHADRAIVRKALVNWA